MSKSQIESLWVELTTVSERGGSIHMIGNGGSAATPSHSAGDWSKELGILPLLIRITSLLSQPGLTILSMLMCSQVNYPLSPNPEIL